MYEEPHHITEMNLSPSGAERSGSSYIFRNPVLDDKNGSPIENIEQFDEIFSYVCDLDSQIICIISVGKLSDNTQESISEGENPRNLVNKTMGDFRNLLKDIPTIVDDYSATDIAYLELNDTSISNNSTIDEEYIHDLWENNGSEINKYHLHLGDLSGAVSIFELENSTYIMSPQVFSRPFGYQTILNTNPKDVTVDPKSPPYWFELIDKLRPYIKLFHWISHRINESKRFNDKIQEIIEDSETILEANINELDTIQQNFSSFRYEWMESHTDMEEELSEINSKVKEVTNEPANDSFGNESRPAILPIWKRSLENLSAELDSVHSRVDEKQEMMSFHLQSTLLGLSSIGSLKLQNEVYKLTVALVVFTIILILLTIVLII